HHIFFARAVSFNGSQHRCICEPLACLRESLQGSADNRDGNPGAEQSFGERQSHAGTSADNDHVFLCFSFWQGHFLHRTIRGSATPALRTPGSYPVGTGGWKREETNVVIGKIDDPPCSRARRTLRCFARLVRQRISGMVKLAAAMFFTIVS